MNDRLLSMLSICRKAGRLITGYDLVCDTADKGGVVLILTAADLSPKSRKEVGFRAERSGITVKEVSLTMNKLEAVLGKKTGIVGITDPGLAANVLKWIRHADEEESHI